jgi:hypothetical protein
MWYSNLEKNIFFSTCPPPILIQLSHHFISASKPAENVFWLLSQSLPHLRFNLFVISDTFSMFPDPVLNRFTRQILPTIAGIISLWISFALRPFAHKKTHNRTLFFCNIFIKNRRHFYYWNQPLNMRMRVCFLDCQEAWLRCYLLIHIENLLHPLQLFYFHLWPIYWPS